MASVTLQANDLAKQITFNVRIRGMRVWRVRCQIGLWLLNLVAWVMGVPFEIEVGADDEYARTQGALA